MAVLYLPRGHFYFRSESFAEFFARLPATLYLMGASVLIALALAAICTVFAKRRVAWLGALLAAVLFAFMCVPVFWLAIVLQFAAAVHGLTLGPLVLQLPTAGISGSENPTIAERLSHLALPAIVLALFQAGAYVDATRDGFSAHRLAAAFAILLPGLVSADVIVELLFAWPGIGRWFWASGGQGGAANRLAFVVGTAGMVIAARAIAQALHLPDARSPEVFEPL